MNDYDLVKEITQNFKNTFAKNSYLLSFEGIEGSGKSTQIKLLESNLSQMGYQVTCLREPGGTKFGEDLRSAILNSETSLEPISEAYLFAASRAQLLKEKVLPLLNKEKQIVILDRYIDSSVAYQGFARNLGMTKVFQIHNIAPLNILPKLTFYLDISLETSMERQKARGNEKDYFEKENNNFYQSLINGYEACASNFPQRIVRIAAQKTPEEVQKDILEAFEAIR